MPQSMTAFAETSPIASAASFTSADTTTAKNVFAAPNTAWRCDAITAVSDDTATVVIDVFLRTVSTNTLLGSFSVPAGTGHAGVALKEFFNDTNIAQVNGLNLNGNQGIQCACEATMTAGKTCVVTVFGGQF